MEIKYTTKALDDIKYWKKSGQTTIQKRIETIINEIVINPYTGIGKPEQLKHEFNGYWSRRINEEHRIIYKIDSDIVYIFSLKGHY
ncbi:MAG: Txe/YoeB family addiction module toxin [Bacteroidales bacterium]|nr:Txe/YoeB family addiction module toxin [Bacteroidales bacterium]